MGDHYVPQYYLQGFAKDDRLWAHDRVTGKTFLTQPKAIANETKMYPPELEAYLGNRIEAPAMAAIDRVRQALPLTSADRVALAQYIVALWKRVPSGRARAAGHLPAVARSVREGVFAQIDEVVKAEPTLEAIAQERKELIDRILTTYEQDDPPPDIWHHSLKEGITPLMVNGLLELNWRYLVADKPTFITCDNPVFFFSRLGLAHAEAEVSIPFSSTVMLWANRRDLPAQWTLVPSPQAIKEFSRRAAYNASRFLYSQTNEGWMQPLHRKTHWNLTRLR